MGGPVRPTLEAPGLVGQFGRQDQDHFTTTGDFCPALPVTRQQQRRLTAAEQVEVAQRYQAGAQMKDLAVDFGTHRTTIAQCLRRLAVPIRRQGLQIEDVPEAARLYLDGWSLSRLGEKFGCDHSDVRNKLVAHGVPMRPRPGWKYPPDYRT